MIRVQLMIRVRLSTPETMAARRHVFTAKKKKPCHSFPISTEKCLANRAYLYHKLGRQNTENFCARISLTRLVNFEIIFLTLATRMCRSAVCLPKKKLNSLAVRYRNILGTSCFSLLQNWAFKYRVFSCSNHLRAPCKTGDMTFDKLPVTDFIASRSDPSASVWKENIEFAL